MRCGARCKRDRHARSRALEKANGHFIPGALADGADHETARVPAVYWSAEYSGGALHRARIVAGLCNAQRALNEIFTQLHHTLKRGAAARAADAIAEVIHAARHRR